MQNVEMPCSKSRTHNERLLSDPLAAVVLGAVDGVEGLVDFVVVLLDGSDGALGDQLHGASILGGLGRGAAAVARRGGGSGRHDSAGALRGDESGRNHFDVLGGLRSEEVVGS